MSRDQAFGESLDPDKLERLGRYEVHLDRKLERTLLGSPMGVVRNTTRDERIAMCTPRLN